MFNNIIIQILTTAKLLKTGQTTSYRDGDDGFYEAGRDVSFTVLGENNPFGTTDRFTDELGGQTYTNNIVIDWSTYDGYSVLGYYKLASSLTGGNWNYAVDYCYSTFTTGGFAGWRLVNENELANIKLRTSSVGWFNYAPFNFNVGVFFHTSTTDPLTTTSAIYQNYNNWYFAGFDKGTDAGIKPFPCRTFTVTGTTLS
jgi:hypothetical protein